MTFRAVESSDWHGDVVTLGVPRFDEVADAAMSAANYAVKEKVDLFIFTGDLTDPDSGGMTFKSQKLAIAIALYLQRHHIPSVWVAGNHDVCEDGSGATTLTPLTQLESKGSGIYVAEVPRLIDLDGDIALLCLPFTAASRGVDIEEAATELWPKNRRVITLSHLSVPGVIPGEETTEMPRGREVLYPFEATKNSVLRIQGHYHRRQTFDPNDGGPPIVIPGSLARLTFGEAEHTPSFLLVEV